MNQSLHAICQTQRVKTIVTCAVFGGALCVACAAVTLADELLESSAVERASDNSTSPFLSDMSAPPTRLRWPQHPVARSSTTANSPARWADLSNPNAVQQLTAMSEAADPPIIDFDRPWTAPPKTSASVHVGPAPSAFTSEPFRGARRLSAAPTLRPLRPRRLPATGYLDEPSMSARIATGPSDAPLPLRSQYQPLRPSSFE